MVNFRLSVHLAKAGSILGPLGGALKCVTKMRKNLSKRKLFHLRFWNFAVSLPTNLKRMAGDCIAFGLTDEFGEGIRHTVFVRESYDSRCMKRECRTLHYSYDGFSVIIKELPTVKHSCFVLRNSLWQHVSTLYYRLEVSNINSINL